MARQRTVMWVMVFAVAAFVTYSGWQGSPPRAVLTGALVWVVGGSFVAWSHRRGRHTALEQAKSLTAEEGGYVLWKPGCTYCEKLLRQMGDDSRVQWVNVWRDDVANDEVRAFNDGNELTPTAVVGDVVLSNPSAGQLRAALDARR